MRPFASPAANELSSWLWIARAAIVATVFVGGNLLLIGRRLAGAFHAPLSTLELAVVGLALAGLALSARWTLAEAITSRNLRWLHFGRWIPFLVAAMGGAAVSLPASPVAGLVLLWGTLVIAAATAGLASRMGGIAERSSATLRLKLSPPTRWPGERWDNPKLTRKFSPTRQNPSQVLMRFEQGNEDRMRGRVVAIVPARRRATSAHVAFCPPFYESPRVTVKTKGSRRDVQVVAAQVLPHGVRFDVKLPQQAPQAIAVLLDFSAAAPLVKEVQ